MDDRTIIEMLWNRVEAGLDALAMRYGPRLQAMARNILGSYQDAEETVNDTYWAVWGNIPPQQPAPLSAFVFRIGRNLALKRRRSNTALKRNGAYDLSLEELAGCIPGPCLEETVSARALGEAIDAFLDTQPRLSRVVFLRRYWFGDCVTDIAAALGMTQGAVSTRLNRTREKLRIYLIKEGYDL